MRKQKYQLAINIATFIIYKVHKIWENKQIIGILLIDIKKAFDYIFE